MVAGIMASGNGTVNRESRLLTREENDQICRMLGNRCEALASSVIQLFTTEPPDHGSWVRRDAGVLCIVKDHLKRSYFLRLYCLARRGLVWEHEIYNSMEYNAPKPFLHTFEGQDCIVGFNFASEEDARVIQNVILQKLDRKQRRMERKSRSSYTTSRHSSTPPYNPPTPQPVVNKAPVMNGMNTPPSRPIQQPLPHNNFAGSRGRGGGGKRKFTKADIGLPSDFRHVSHVGWDPNKGFDLDNVEDPQLKHFFVKAGVSDSQLQDPETREFIYDFINQHGGLDAVKEDTTTHQPPPVPARVVPHPPPAHHRSVSETRVAPPPPPSRGPPPVLPSTPPVATHHHARPPPPPSLRTLPSRGENTVQTGAPPPPPPPPPPAAPMPPPELPATTTRSAAPSSGPDPRNALMDAIRSGKPLKRVEPENKRPSSGGDTRTDLLDQIRGGIELKAVQHIPKPAPDVGEANTLAGALARALQERSRAIHSDSDSTSSSSEDEDEWED